MIDTQNKRRAVQAYTFGLMRPVPDGSIGMGDRESLAWLYAREQVVQVPSGPDQFTAAVGQARLGLPVAVEKKRIGGDIT